MTFSEKLSLYSKFKEALDIYPTEEYVRLLRRVQRRGNEADGWKEQWEPGVYPANMAIGATLAFREKFEGFHEMTIVVGYAGTRLVEEANETIDVYYLWDAVSGEIFELDSLGIMKKRHESLKELVEALGIDSDEKGK